MQVRAGLNENGALKKSSEDMTPRMVIGSIVYAPTSAALPHTLICDGSAVSRSTYADLFAVIGTAAGSGNGSTTFNLPDLRNVWAVGTGSRAVLADTQESLPDIYGRIAFRIFQTQAEQDYRGISIIRWGITDSETEPWEGAYAAFGAFSAEENEKYPFAAYIAAAGLDIHPNSYTGDVVTFRASSNNAIYGRSAHVTPASVALTPCIVYE